MTMSRGWENTSVYGSLAPTRTRVKVKGQSQKQLLNISAMCIKNMNIIYCFNDRQVLVSFH